jgi:hypothetical protein
VAEDAMVDAVGQKLAQDPTLIGEFSKMTSGG